MQKNETFYPQLDSLRAIAVLLVIVSHWFSNDHFLNRYTANGILGVTLFFVLSGFLITGILLKSKLKIEAGGSKKKAFTTFYIRRSLRIFPVYYLLLLILVLFNIADIRESFWWHFFYGSNFYFWIKGAFGGQLSHFWSLAVEEQFYLIWPTVIFFIPKRFIPHALLSGIIGGILFRYFIVTPNHEMGRFLMPGSLDSFCIGGLLAYGRQFKSSIYASYLLKKKLLVIFSVVLLIVVHTPLLKHMGADVYLSLYLFLISVAFGILIDRVADTVNTPVIGIILSNPVILYFGKISYGVYLFHNFIPYFYGIELPGISPSLSMYAIQVLRLLLLVGISSVSWFLFEKPVLQLKKHFVYS